MLFETSMPSKGGEAKTSCAYSSSRCRVRETDRSSVSKSNDGSTKSWLSGKKNFMYCLRLPGHSSARVRSKACGGEKVHFATRSTSIHQAPPSVPLSSGKWEQRGRGADGQGALPLVCQDLGHP